ncbi:MAG: glucose-6-phosphate isomerase [Actinobacteria bacterium]|nr:glucose-6-phosphate isomerase [Actinomycetota bacterium]MSX15262.1 glucose-6-phosphate isomerase [Actinomycetota bacterium]MSX36149.1 glucose-6-phosphate isomerase [Actinomycetota bacterium]MSX76905.1 glucose-6-phosphate isomerase [Actinomycetota bacterium]MSZ71153.1 glucose-6-phosphate isomerase [Actinomycetota bacterium]
MSCSLPQSLRAEFAKNPERASQMTIQAGDLRIDYSKQLIDEIAIARLLDLASARKATSAFARMANGEPINFTEGRAVGHMALRTPRGEKFLIDGVDVVPAVWLVLDQMANLARAIRIGEFVGSTGRKIRNVVNIGIGGSDLGPAMVYEALRGSRSPDITCRFVSNVDPADLEANLAGLDPAETLFIVASKTFTTVETLANARAAREWLAKQLGESAVEKHFVALSTNTQAVREFGIDTKNMFEFWDWVGGRFSVPSAIGLSVMIAVGPEVFFEFLGGMHSMDTHAAQAKGRANAPLMLALINIWNTAALQTSSRAIIPYSFDLRRFPAYLQQLIMESNGKSVRSDGTRVPYATSPVIWGEPGTNGQHAFMQLLHQGTNVVPIDFIGFARSSATDEARNELLFTNLLAQSRALAFGRSIDELPDSSARPHRVFEGNRPSTTIVAPELSAGVLGQLIALYEHSTFFEGVIWDINSFDQWGVELGKELALSIGLTLADFSTNDHPELDSSTHTLLSWFTEHRQNNNQ